MPRTGHSFRERWVNPREEERTYFMPGSGVPKFGPPTKPKETGQQRERRIKEERLNERVEKRLDRLEEELAEDSVTRAATRAAARDKELENLPPIESLPPTTAETESKTVPINGMAASPSSIKFAVQELAEDAIKAYREILSDPKAPARVKADVAGNIIAYTIGKPVQTTVLSGSAALMNRRSLDEFSDEEILHVLSIAGVPFPGAQSDDTDAPDEQPQEP